MTYYFKNKTHPYIYKWDSVSLLLTDVSTGRTLYDRWKRAELISTILSGDYVWVPPPVKYEYL